MKKGNIVLAVICAAIGLGVIAIASRYPTAAAYKTGVPGPGLWPIAISVVMIVCSLLLAHRSWKMPSELDQKIILWGTGPRRVYITMALLLIYVALLEPLGFIIDTTILEFIFIQWFYKKNPIITFIISAAVTMVIFSVFQFLLDVPIGTFGLIQF